MKQHTRIRQQQGLLRTLATLLLAVAAGCGEEKKANGPPTFQETTQSATGVRGLETVTLFVRAQDERSRSLRFSWAASAGTLGIPSDTDTTSEVTWTPPACDGRVTGDTTLTVKVTDEQGDAASHRFTLVLNRCVAVSIATGLRHSLALRSDGTVWAWGDNSRASSATGAPSCASPLPGCLG